VGSGVDLELVDAVGDEKLAGRTRPNWKCLPYGHGRSGKPMSKSMPQQDIDFDIEKVALF
jgi:hypothetical protein